MLQGRERELSVIGGLLAEARSGGSGVLVVRGEPGVGKSALLDHAERIAEGAAVLRGTGVETEVELPFAALHMLLLPALDRLDDLPGPQAAALRGAFGLAATAAADRFLIGLATLSLLAELAEERPLLVLVDDAQWLDEASAAALLFAVRRLRSEGVAVLIAAREDRDAFPAAGLPELGLAGLDRDDAERLLGTALPAHLRDQVLTEAGGNPLALIELAKSARDGGTGAAGPLPLTRRLLSAFAGQLRVHADATRTLLAVAAAEDTGELGVVLAAAAAIGVRAEDLEAAEEAGLVTVAGGAVRFRHPLLRSAAYQGLPSSQLRAIHRALAGAVSGDRRAWHLALAATGPDEEIADALEQSAERAGARHGYAAMATAYERAARLSAEPAPTARRLAAAAMAAREAGQSGRSAELSERAARLTEDPATLARLAEVRAAVAYDRGEPRTAARLVIDGAARLAEADPRTAARMVASASLNVWSAADPALTEESARLLDRLDLPADEGILRFARGLGHLYGGDLEAGYPLLDEFLAQPVPPNVQGRLMFAYPAFVTGRLAKAVELTDAAAADCRAEGRIRLLPFALNHVAYLRIIAGSHRQARDTAEEALQLALDTGQPHLAAGLRGQLAWLAAVEGDEERARAVAEEGLRFAADHNSPAVGLLPTWALAMLDLTAGREEEALDRLRGYRRGGSHFGGRIVVDEVEAAVRLGAPERVRDAVADLERWTALSGETWARALVARCRALLHDAEDGFSEALKLYEESPQPYEEARTRLAYGEWLRRRRRKGDARPYLRQAHEVFERLGARPWAERAAAELRAAGETTASRRGVAPGAALTAQELQVVRLAATGATNRDIAAHLLLSPRTIGQHLYKAYPKLGVSSRTELARLDLDAL